MARLRSPRTDDPFQLSFGLSRYRQCCAACPHATQHSRSDAIVKLCMRHYTSDVARVQPTRPAKDKRRHAFSLVAAHMTARLLVGAPEAEASTAAGRSGRLSGP